MIGFINRLTGGIMYVTEERVEEYKTAGHKPVKQLKPKKNTNDAAKKGNSKK